MAFCPRCGAQLPDGATFCAQCGQPLTPVTPNPGYYSAPAPQPAPAPAPKKKKRRGLVFILILVLLAVGGYFLYDYFGPFGDQPGDKLQYGTEPRESVLPDGDDDSNTMTNKEYRDWLLGD